MSLKNLIKKITPTFLLASYHYFLVAIGAFLYGFPSRQRRDSPSGAAQKLTVIGITGTSGKSTVVELTARILTEANYKVASLSSIKFKIRDREWENKLKMTMPGRMKLQRFLRRAVKAGCKYAVLEVTSEGIKQYRHKFIDFDIAVLTNLSPEHIEAHGGFEKYREAKSKLFQTTKKIHIINLDDENAEFFWRIPAEKKIGYKMDDIKILPSNFSLLGRFNLYNALAAAKVGIALGVPLEVCKRALGKVKGIPGRMEIVIKEPFTVIVDYAHTPEALENVYKIASNLKPKSYNLKPNLICVLGACGGGRDKWKRPVLGKLAVEYCQEIIVTNEDPYDENPLKIMEDIESGFSQIPNSLDARRRTPRRAAFQIPKYMKILDRREAIRKALELARKNDVVIITGKGSEPWMCVKGGRRILWDDRQTVKEEFQKIYEKI